MDERSNVPDSVVIGQDDHSEVHVQPMVQSGRRHLDIRTWRRGPTGFAPSRNALTVEAVDLDALQAGIAELLESSGGGQSVARVVWENGDGRRLRAETEPFGTRYMARLGFWQRVRDTWRPADDGLLLPADRLRALQASLERFRPWVLETAPEARTTGAVGARLDALRRWPAPGADWLTVEPGRVAFHPRGVRITFDVVERSGRHALDVRQWRRQDSLWLPERHAFTFDVADLDALLLCLGEIAEGGDGDLIRDVPRAGGDSFHVSVDRGNGGMVTVESDDRSVLRVPTEYLPRFGRLLVQGWLLLVGWLSEEERTDLQDEENGTEPDAARSATTVQPPAPVFQFGAESETPGVIVPGDGTVRLVVEGFLLPRAIELVDDAIAPVVRGLEGIHDRLTRQEPVDFTILYDRPHCAVHSRVGTALRSDAVELRVWKSATHNDSITFEAGYLPEVIDGLRQTLRAKGLQEPEPPAPAPAAQDEVAPGAEDSLTQPEPEHLEPDTSPVSLGEMQLGHECVVFSLRTRGERRSLHLSWNGEMLELPVDNLEELLSDIRSLYYDALRGRLGQTLVVVGPPPIEVRIRSRGPQMYLSLQRGDSDPPAELSFPAGDVPNFLNAMRELGSGEL